MSTDRRKFLTQGFCVGLAGLALPGTAGAFGRRRGRCCPPEPCCPVPCLEPIYPLNISKPAEPINGPFHTLLRKAKLGDLILVEISYPVAPPFPTCAAVLAECPIFCPVGVYSTPMEVVVLTTAPQQGKIGVSFLNALVKAVGLGTSSFTVRVSMDDGSIRDVPFAFDITR